MTSIAFSNSSITGICRPVLVAVLFLSGAAIAGQEAAPPDTSLALRGEEQGTELGSMTVEEENRVSIDFERPDLRIDLDARQAPGLNWGGPEDILANSVPDPAAPFVDVAGRTASPYAPRPWLDGFRTGALARFRPAVEHVETWTLTVVDSRGDVVMVFSGEGDPPDEINWDGRTQSGEACLPGFTYSYVFECVDRAGNSRRIVGDGFRISPYRVVDDEVIELFLAGTHLSPTTPDPLLLEIASWLNLRCAPGDPIRVVAVARSYGEADALGLAVQARLQELVLGDAARVAVTTLVEAGAPEGGTLMIAADSGSRERRASEEVE